MKTRFLFPHKFRTLGYWLIAVGMLTYAVTGIYSAQLQIWNVSHHFLGQNMEIIEHDVMLLTLIIGLLLVGFTKEKIEDEQIAQSRLDSLQWAIYFNYIVLMICTIFLNGFDFLGVMIYNMVTPLLFFIIRFRWKIYLLNRVINIEEKAL
jgi:hypothetical protein